MTRCMPFASLPLVVFVLVCARDGSSSISRIPPPARSALNALAVVSRSRRRSAPSNAAVVGSTHWKSARLSRRPSVRYRPQSRAEKPREKRQVARSVHGVRALATAAAAPRSPPKCTARRLQMSHAYGSDWRDARIEASRHHDVEAGINYGGDHERAVSRSDGGGEVIHQHKVDDGGGGGVIESR